MNTLSNPLDEGHKNTLKRHEIKIGGSFILDKKSSPQNEKYDVTDESFLNKLTPELSNKIKETITAAKQEAQGIIANANNSADQIRQQAQEQGLQQGIKEGHEQGYKDGYNQAINDFREKVISLDRLINNIINAKSQIYHSGEDELVEFIMLIAKKLAHTQIHADAQALKNIIIDASVELREKESIKVSVHPSLAEKIHSISDEVKNAIYGLKTIKIIEDKTISPDGVIIESPDSRVDARLESQVDLLINDLFKEKEETPILEDTDFDDKLE